MVLPFGKKQTQNIVLVQLIWGAETQRKRLLKQNWNNTHCLYGTASGAFFRNKHTRLLTVN